MSDSQVSTERTRTRSTALSLAERLDVLLPHLGVAREHGAVGERDVLEQAAAEQSRVEQAGVAVVVDVLDPDATGASRSPPRGR